MLARRSGRLDEANERYTALLEGGGADDPVVSNNLANLWFRNGRSREAIALYEGAAGRLESATLLFNLSQAYAKEFRMEDFEITMVRAQTIAPSKVPALNSGKTRSKVNIVFFRSILIIHLLITISWKYLLQIPFPNTLSPKTLQAQSQEQSW